MKKTTSVGRCLKRKTMLVWVKEYISKNFATCKSLCNLQKLDTPFKEKHPNVNIAFSKFCALRPKWFVLASSKMTNSFCVCSAHQIDAIDFALIYKDLIKKIVCETESNKCVSANPVLAMQLWKNFLIRNSTKMKMTRNLITVKGTLRIEQYWPLLQPLTKNTKSLWLMLLMI